MKDKHMKAKKLKLLMHKEQKRAQREYSLAVADWTELTERIMLCQPPVRKPQPADNYAQNTSRA